MPTPTEHRTLQVSEHTILARLPFEKHDEVALLISGPATTALLNWADLPPQPVEDDMEFKMTGEDIEGIKDTLRELGHDPATSIRRIRMTEPALLLERTLSESDATRIAARHWSQRGYDPAALHGISEHHTIHYAGDAVDGTNLSIEVTADLFHDPVEGVGSVEAGTEGFWPVSR